MALKQRRMRVKDFVAESLHKIASHSSDGETLHRTADIVAASTDHTMVTILEEVKIEEENDIERAINQNPGHATTAEAVYLERELKKHAKKSGH